VLCGMAALITLLWVVGSGLLPWRAHVRERLAPTPPRGPVPHPNTTSVSLLRVEQPVDHFAASDTRTWHQRVFVRREWFDAVGRRGPVFVCVGGEGPPFDATVLVASVHCNDAVELAPVAGALLIAIEHRFYGPSPADRPLPSFSTSELRVLSSSQAVEDLTRARAAVARALNVPQAARWVTFGGSYPGLMAGYARLKLPHLFHAAVSSSAPWRAVVDMPQYNNVVAAALANEAVGGSPACAEAVREGHTHILARLNSATASRRDLEVEFNFCSKGALEDRPTALAWAGDGVISVPAQSNDPSCTDPACDIRAVCGMLLGTAHPLAAPTPSRKHARDDGPIHDSVAMPPLQPQLPLRAPTPDERVRALARVSRAQRGGECIATEAVDPEAAMAELLNTSSSTRAWPYQTCAEFGFFQTCEVGSACPFARGAVRLEESFRMCERAFGMNRSHVEAHVAATNARYGGVAPGASRVLHVNGDVDPWSALGVLESPGPAQPVHVAPGASHHAWTHPADTVVQEAVRVAKRVVWEHVQRWAGGRDSLLPAS